MAYQSTKTYGNDRGFSCAFRQWSADSHCNLIHGYSLGFKFIFEAEELDERNWVYDFGNCKWIKEWIEDTFDHKTAVDINDPYIETFRELNKAGLIDLREMDGAGCEKFAEHTFSFVAPKVLEGTGGRVRLKSVEVFEHGAKSAVVDDLILPEHINESREVH